MYDGCSYFCLFYVYGYTVWWLLWVIFAAFSNGYKMAHTMANIHTTIKIEIPWGIHSAHPLQENFGKQNEHKYWNGRHDESKPTSEYSY